ncbi:hypothetical protein ACFL5B_03535 [Candidatus Latescibacterota bacterium]
MGKAAVTIFLAVLVISVFPGQGDAVEIDELLQAVSREVSGNRARDYTMRLWQYDKWNTFPMWEKTAREAQTIMTEREFDEAEVINTPTDGVTRYGAWTNPIAWDVKQATLEVIEPANLPDEYRYLCNYMDNPTSLNFFSSPTPPEGIETELVVLERSNPEALRALNARGKIVLVSSNGGGMKKYLDSNGIPGIVSDQIEGNNRDYISANHWLNTWSDFPGGWMMTASDSKNNFCFSISQKKGNYLRNLIRQGRTVKVRAKIDSRYYTDGTLPYVTGCVKGYGSEDEDVLIVGHMYEWGANDNCSGSAAIIEAVGALNGLIRSGVLPRPKRSIRVWLGFELYGSMAYTIHNLDRLQNRTIACVCCDTPAENYDLSTTALSISMNFNACPSFTDAVFPEIARRYYSRYSPYKLWKTRPFRSGIDNFFGDPMIGVPLNAVTMNNGGHLHHNSMDTIDKTDPRTLRDLSILNAAYLYYIANAGYDEIPVLANLGSEHGMRIVLGKMTEMKNRVSDVNDGEMLGELLVKGVSVIEYYTDLQKKAIHRIEKLVPENRRGEAGKLLKPYIDSIDEYGELMVKQFRDAVKEKSDRESIKVVRYRKEEGQWEREAATIIPKRRIVGTLTLEEIPPEEWRDITGSPRWWSARGWAAASYFWCDGKRNLNEIRELVELEADRPIRNFDLIQYYRLLERYDIVEFMEK